MPPDQTFTRFKFVLFFWGADANNCVTAAGVYVDDWEYVYQGNGDDCMMDLWNIDYENPESISPFIPAHFLVRKFVCIITTLNFVPKPGRRFKQADNVNIVVPLTSKFL